MVDHVTAERAIEWLEAQLVGLGKIRNASTRDAGFRVWRQETLAFIQQIWPERPGRWHRFRRVPFAPSSPRADEHVARETFERGFAEMRRLLKMWVAEIKHKGLVHVDDGSEGVEEPPKPRKPALKRSKRPLKDMLELGKFDEEEAPQDEARPATTESVMATPAPPSETQPDFLAQTLSDAMAQARHDERPSGGARGSPKAAVGRSAKAVQGGAGILALAQELENFGVPYSERELLRAALIELAQRLDAGTITWETMQDAVALVMRYPGLGRRALPVLQPHLDRAA